MGKPDVEKSEETKKSNSKQNVEKANEHTEWLPDGWSVEVRTRKSGAHMGSGYKCYIDPLSGYKFYSKPEVLRYLETKKDNKTIKDNNHTSKKEKKCTDMDSPSNVCIKTIKDNSCTSKKEKKCTDMDSPSNVCIKTIKDNSCTSKKEKKCTVMDSPSNVVVEKSTVEDLPPGWIKEVKIRKNSNGVRKDPFYTDPVSGYVFRSKKDVLRYLESGVIGKCAFKPSRGQIQDGGNLTPSPVAKRQKLKQSAPKQQLFVAKELVDKGNLELPDVNNSSKGQDVNVLSGMMVAPVPTSETVAKMHSLEDGAAAPEMKKTSDHSISKNKKEFNVRHRSSPRLARIEPVQLANDAVNDQTLLVPKRNLRKSRTTLDADMGKKSSQNFNGVPEIEPVHKMQQKAMNTSNNLYEDQVVFNEQPHQLERDKIEDSKPETHTNSNKSSKKKEHCISRRASKRLAEYKSEKSKDELKVELQQSEGGPFTELADHAPKNGESGNKRRKSPKISPTAANQLKKHEDEEMDDEKSEPQLSFAFHYSWSDPCLEFAINTLTGVLPPAEDSVDNGPITIPKTDMQKTLSDNVTGTSSNRQNNSVGNGSTTVPETDIQKTLSDNVTGRSRDSQNNSVHEPTTVPETDVQKTFSDNVTGRCRDSQNNSFDNITGSRNRNTQIRSNKSKRKKDLKVPMRLSKRLAGLEPEVLPSERALEYSTKKSCKEEPTSAAILTNGASDHPDAGAETKLTLHASDSLKTEVLGESSNRSEKSYDAQTVPCKEQLQKIEAENISDERSEPQLPLPFGDSWSDPCLEFAIKTLTGALPVDSAVDILPVMTPDVDNPSNKELHGSVATGINGEAQDNSIQSQNKKELYMDGQPSKLLLGEPELRTSSTSCENAPKFTTGESHSVEGYILRNLGRESLHIEAGDAGQFVHHSRRNISTQIHEEPLKKKGHVEGEFGTMEHPPLPTETLNHDNTELQFCPSFMDSWSDPCLEFAFKTLTGVIPVEENLAIQGSFQEPANCHEPRDGGSTLPDFGSSSFSQSDVSFHYDIGVKPMPGQQSSMSSSFLSMEKATLQGCPGVDPQKHYSQYNKNFQRR